MEELRNWILDLKKFTAANPDWVVLVEGKRDVAALKRLGVENVWALKGKGFHDVAEELSHRFKGVVVLTDFDQQGERICRKLTAVLKSYGLKIDSSFRSRLRDSGVKFVEEIPKELGLFSW